MRTTLTINEDLLNETKALSGAKTKKEAIEVALAEFVKRRKVKKLLKLESKIDFSYSLEEFLENRKKDVPDR